MNHEIAAAGIGRTRLWVYGLKKYRDLGITQFILSDTPYLTEIERQGLNLLPLLRDEQTPALALPAH